ncbi:MAG: phenylalanine--tRNA ligase subunit beta [Candidatus Methylomirabilota bacterium]|nr:phenylalanine--tRNA ligase subunit beta [candidate division NC10 bacterium]PWB43487.1 MAG: phenylalanine--tRNA ligase subunit beta [candidate division NC10 bacterium]
MKVSLKWLSDYVNVALPAQELAHRLTMSGTEVGGIEERGNGWPGIVVARVEFLGPHPTVDSLTLVGVELLGERITVVSGATNLKVGDKVPYASVGACLTDAQTGRPTVVDAAQIQGVTSRGVLCSEKELGLSEAHEGVLILPGEVEIGVPLNTVLGDTVLDLEVTPNRPDCLSMIGVAREVAAITEEPLHLPDLSYQEEGGDVQDEVQVDILTPDLCPRYSATAVHGVSVGPSPSWLQRRLMAAGVRPINNVVDVTNYVMLEYGQPLHAFDYDTIRDRRIVVRRAAPGESLRTLDGVVRTLSPEMLVIADADRPVALAGIMGGSETEVTQSTTHVLLESANFNPASIRQSCRVLRLRTEASFRFDKGLSPVTAPVALRRATKLLVEICGGTASRGLQDAFPAPREAMEVGITPAELRRVLGIDLTVAQIREVLAGRLGFECREDGTGLRVIPPAHRGDIQIPVDLVEEVARLIGYDRIPTATLAGHLPDHPPQPIHGLIERISDLLVGCGLQEVITYSLVGRRLPAKMVTGSDLGTAHELRLANPMTPDQETLRTSLLPSLLECLHKNIRQDEAGPRLFEIGRIYLPRHDDLPLERHMLVIGLTGPRWPRQWSRAVLPSDFYDLKGIVEVLLDRLKLGPIHFIHITDQPPFHPGRTTAVYTGDVRLGVIGELHPAVGRALEVRAPVYLAEFDLEQLLDVVGEGLWRVEPPSRFPAVRRDLALVVPEHVPVAELFEIIRQAGRPLLEQVELFDLFRGGELPHGYKSCGIGLVFRSSDQTLTDDAVVQVETHIIQQLRRITGAHLRG